MARYEAHIRPTWPRGEMQTEAASDSSLEIVAFIEKRLDELFPGQWQRLNQDQWGIQNSPLIMAHLWINYTEEEVERDEMADLERSIAEDQARLAELRAKYGVET